MIHATISSSHRLAYCWARYVTSVDLTKMGSYALQGFRLTQHRLGKNHVFRDLNTSGVIVFGAALYPNDVQTPDAATNGLRVAFVVYHDAFAPATDRLQSTVNNLSTGQFVELNLEADQPDIECLVFVRSDWDGLNTDSYRETMLGPVYKSDPRIENPFFWLAAHVAFQPYGVPISVQVPPGQSAAPVASVVAADEVFPNRKHHFRTAYWTSAGEALPPDGFTYIRVNENLALLAPEYGDDVTLLRPLHHLASLMREIDEPTRIMLNEQADLLETLAVAYRMKAHQPNKPKGDLS